MALEKHIYEALEDIVGSENISQEPAILDTYTFFNWSEALLGTKFMARPEAVLLPGSVEEIRAIVKACNRYRIRFKAFSTGWLSAAGLTGERGIILDLRRMNRILEINEKDMYAVVEPYVCWSQLQAEVMKVGLNCPVIEAGGNCSPLASLTSGWGMGSKCIYMGHNERNVLGVEWVLPTGEILRLGSVGSGAGWFSGDGPGPSLRGIMRGYIGAWGGLGVFTKVGIKLYHWPGPPSWPITGVTPYYEVHLPETIRLHAVYFPNWDAIGDAVYKIGEAEIAAELMKGGLTLFAAFLAASNEEIWRMVNFLYSITKGGPCIGIVIEGNSKRDFEYKEKVLRQILSETGGRFLQPIEHDTMQRRVISQVIMAGTCSRAAYRPTGAFCSAFGGMDTFDMALNQAKVGAELKKEYIQKGLILDDRAENAWAVPYENTHFGHTEEIIHYDPAEPDSYRAAGECLYNAFGASKDQALGTPFACGTNLVHELFGPTAMNYHLWLRKIKKTFDPNTASDPSAYILPE